MELIRSILIFTLLSVITQALSDPIKVSTKNGDVMGYYDKLTGNRVFLGIPYASPPVGPLRFKPPQPLTSWAPKTREALAFGPSCNSVGYVTLNRSVILNQSEDCLYLNVWAPANVAEPLAVMVWIYGGSFTSGSSSEPSYSGNNMSKQGNVIVVSFNYRLGIFGFLESELLSKEDPVWPTSGNYGLLDQNFALQWVKNNIQAFGGDPGKVTIFGESAGAFSVCYHLLMPKSKGLFIRAILQSGSCAYPNVALSKQSNKMIPSTDLTTAYGRSSDYIRGLGCSDLKCLRNLSQDAIKNFQEKTKEFEVWPHVDGIVLPDDPISLFKNGTYNKVDVIFGSVLDEGTLFSELDISYSEFTKRVEYYFPADYGKILEFYPNSIYKTGYAALSQLKGDFLFLCPGRTLLRLIDSNHGSSYQYFFVHTPSFLTEQNKLYMGAFHMAEIFYAFNNPYDNFLNYKNSSFTQNEVVLANQMLDFWTSFAKQGLPTSNNTLISWKKFTNIEQNYIRLNVTELKMEKDLSQKVCDLYDTVTSKVLGSNFISKCGFIYLAIWMLIFI
jgi:para-nitrobenzyl esterase